MLNSIYSGCVLQPEFQAFDPKAENKFPSPSHIMYLSSRISRLTSRLHLSRVICRKSRIIVQWWWIKLQKALNRRACGGRPLSRAEGGGCSAIRACPPIWAVLFFYWTLGVVCFAERGKWSIPHRFLAENNPELFSGRIFLPTSEYWMCIFNNNIRTSDLSYAIILAKIRGEILFGRLLPTEGGVLVFGTCPYIGGGYPSIWWGGCSEIDSPVTFCSTPSIFFIFIFVGHTPHGPRYVLDAVPVAACRRRLVLLTPSLLTHTCLATV